MKELELSVMSHGPQALKQLESQLARFEAKHGVCVKVQVLDWADAWEYVVKVALYNDGPDVSEIGKTWVGDLVRMAALRDFSADEVIGFGGAEAFLQSSWQSGIISEQSVLKTAQVWGIPWMVDTRFVFFRKSVFREFGIKEENAFQTTEQLAKTLNMLLEAGVEMPWVQPTLHGSNTIHNVSSWVWGEGGHFVSQDGKKTCFTEPAAMKGLREYFSLVRFLVPEARGLNEVDSDGMYWTGKAAVTMSGPWVLHSEDALEEVVADTGYAPAPGVPFIGGSHLVVWNHVPYDKQKDAVALIRFLTSSQEQVAYNRQIGMLPSRLDAFALPPYSTNSFYKHLVERLKIGRSFRTVPLWGLVEDRLTTAFGNIYAELLAEQSDDLDEILKRHLNTLKKRLDLTLAND